MAQRGRPKKVVKPGFWKLIWLGIKKYIRFFIVVLLCAIAINTLLIKKNKQVVPPAPDNEPAVVAPENPEPQKPQEISEDVYIYP